MQIIPRLFASSMNKAMKFQISGFRILEYFKYLT